MSSAVESVFDIAFWFVDTALSQNEYLQPQKLHRLLFLSQAYYSVAFGGRALMPAVFIAGDMGPVEPNVYRAFAKGRPDIDADLFLSEEIKSFLESIWRRFGNHTPDRLATLTKDTLAYKQAFKKGPRTEIPLQAMRHSFAVGRETPSVDQVVKPKVMRSQTGASVTVKAWKPKATAAESTPPMATARPPVTKRGRPWPPTIK
ncbi:MAG: hypothetical protein A3G18_12400 [Rhodospirillales bacterium RIFCSPLOWO2_12_FULL_58_28]|nr:MAG: hypothetical protein A3H92_12415 [Rhodospirillales bacterium RIFCSPLOWO2_02_FULL_58_16]OHC79661.1 MAG: hypothetical protein A3G18_12400 [Rhodospirillales bacterium RIFCSPLOWO2_12_FULL_58_28]